MTPTSNNGQQVAPRLIRLPEVENKVGMRKSAIYAKIQAGTFPAPLKLNSRMSCWPESTINEWIFETLRAGGSK